MSVQDSSDSPLVNPVLPPPLKSIRFELLGPAINFLKDPQVQSAPLSKRLAFLEGKGLTPEEIDLAIIRSTESANTFDIKNGSIMSMSSKNHNQTSTSTSNIKSFLLTTAIIIGTGSLIISNYDSIKSYTRKIFEKLGTTISKSVSSSTEQLDKNEKSKCFPYNTENKEKEHSEIKRIEFELKESIKELKDLMEEREKSLINRFKNIYESESKTKDKDDDDEEEDSNLYE